MNRSKSYDMIWTIRLISHFEDGPEEVVDKLLDGALRRQQTGEEDLGDGSATRCQNNPQNPLNLQPHTCASEAWRLLSSCADDPASPGGTFETLPPEHPRYRHYHGFNDDDEVTRPGNRARAGPAPLGCGSR